MSRRLPGWTLPAAGIGLPPLGVLGAILVLKPYYGVVVDAICSDTRSCTWPTSPKGGPTTSAKWAVTGAVLAFAGFAIARAFPSSTAASASERRARTR